MSATTNAGRFGWLPGGSEEDARQALCRLGRHLYRRGWVAGAAGNFSLGLEGDLLVTPRGKHKAHLSPEELVRLSLADPDPVRVALATTELPLHRACHAVVAGPLVVLHTHAPSLTALGMGDGTPSVEGEISAEDLGLPPELGTALGPLALVPFRRSGSEALAEALEDVVVRGVRVAILRRHGVVTLGTSLEEALDRTELGELGARTALLARIPRG